MDVHLSLSKLQTGEDSIQLKIKPGPWSSETFSPLTSASCFVKWEGWKFSSFFSSVYLSFCYLISLFVYSLIFTGLGPGNNGEILSSSSIVGRNKPSNGDMGRELWQRLPGVQAGASRAAPSRKARGHWRGNGRRGGGLSLEEEEQESELFWKTIEVDGVSDVGKASGQRWKVCDSGEHSRSHWRFFWKTGVMAGPRTEKVSQVTGWLPDPEDHRCPS